MARRNQGINVKVPRAKVIKALEQALVKLETNYAKQDVEDKKYQQQVTKLATAKFAKAENVRVNVRWNNSVNVDFDLPASAINLPKEPVKTYETMNEYAYKETKEEIENAIRVLKMCDDELISTATYGGITKYL